MINTYFVCFASLLLYLWAAAAYIYITLGCLPTHFDYYRPRRKWCTSEWRISSISLPRWVIITMNERAQKFRAETARERKREGSSCFRSSNEYFRSKIVIKSQNRCWFWSRIHCASPAAHSSSHLSMYKSVVERDRGKETDGDDDRCLYSFCLLLTFQALKIDYHHMLKRQYHSTCDWCIFNFFDLLDS